MTWLVIRNAAGTALVEHHALVGYGEQVISRHETIEGARQALVEYRRACELEELRARGQKDLFS